MTCSRAPSHPNRSELDQRVRASGAVRGGHFGRDQAAVRTSGRPFGVPAQKRRRAQKNHGGASGSHRGETSLYLVNDVMKVVSGFEAFEAEKVCHL